MGGKNQRPEQYYPPAPFITQGLADIRFIRNHAKRKERLLWDALTEIGNEEKHRRFTRGTRFIAARAMMSTRCARDAIKTLARIGMIRSHQASSGDMLTIELLGAPHTPTAAKSAEGPAANFADIKEEAKEEETQKKKHRGHSPLPLACLLGKEAPRKHYSPPTLKKSNDPESYEYYAKTFSDTCRQRTIHEIARFVAHNVFNKSNSDTLEALVAQLPEEQVYAICRDVYCRGQRSQPAQSASHRAGILTNRLKELAKRIGQSADSSTSSPEATLPGGIDAQDAGCQGVVAQN